MAATPMAAWAHTQVPGRREVLVLVGDPDLFDAITEASIAKNFFDQFLPGRWLRR
ncbi:MAG: hypothetical protein R2715_08190 [Ilumatobacteraceae bacterium]